MTDQAKIALLRKALRVAITLLQQWHDEDAESKPYRFDLSDHPRVMPLFTALERTKDGK
jgi:hypothetical protein